MLSLNCLMIFPEQNNETLSFVLMHLMMKLLCPLSLVVFRWAVRCSWILP